MADGNHADLKQMGARILALLEPELAADGLDLLDIRIFKGGGRVQLRIYVDLLEGGITLDQVARASRTVGMLLEEADPFSGQYVIEVSSPGIRRPLRKLEHYEAAVGHKVDLNVPGPGRRRIRGVLQEIDGDELVVAMTPQAGSTTETTETTEATETTETPEEEPSEVRVKWSRVLEANLDPDFDAQALINADRRRQKEEKRVKRQANKKVRKSRPKAPKKPVDDSSTGETK